MGLFILLGLGAGTLTTLGGMGGGQLMVLALAALLDPRAAIVVTAPALLVGNLHRAWTFRAAFEPRLVVTFAAGAIPGSLLGGSVTPFIPAGMIQGLLLGTTALSIARAVGVWRPKMRASALLPAGFGIGLLSAGSGTGLLLAPLLLAHGLTGPAYLVTSSLCAASLHVGRVAGYAVSGLLAPMLGQSLLLSAAIVAGNVLGERLRRLVPVRLGTLFEQATLVACVLVAVLSAGG